MNATKTQWTHKVVKQSRDGQGQWFAYRAAFTGSLEACEAYAASFLADQLSPTESGNSLKGSMGHRITVQARGGKIVKVLRYDA